MLDYWIIDGMIEDGSDFSTLPKGRVTVSWGVALFEADAQILGLYQFAIAEDQDLVLYWLCSSWDMLVSKITNIESISVIGLICHIFLIVLIL